MKRCLNETINKDNDFISNRTKFTESILRQDPFYAVFPFLRAVFMDLFWKCLYSLTYSINLKVLLSYCRVDYFKKNDKNHQNWMTWSECQREWKVHGRCKSWQEFRLHLLFFDDVIDRKMKADEANLAANHHYLNCFSKEWERRQMSYSFTGLDYNSAANSMIND